MALLTSHFNTTNSSTTAVNYNYNYMLSSTGMFSAEILVVGGGGGGGGSYSTDYGGGGGAGGFISLSAILTNPTSYQITVGVGGIAGQGGFNGAGGGNGGDSSIIDSTNSFLLSVVALGGGGGGTDGDNGLPGGSGGGGATRAIGGQGVLYQGFSGGNGGSSSTYGGGGGGASEPGNTNGNGFGGDGKQWRDGIVYAGGGAGGTSTSVTGGDGGGGRNTPGEDGKGGGGSGNHTGNGYAGGSGVVVISYPAPQKANGGDVITVGNDGYVYHYFYQSGIFTVLDIFSYTLQFASFGANLNELLNTSFSPSYLLEVPITTNKILELSDRNKVVSVDSASTVGVTVPTHSTTPFPIGSVINVYRAGTGNVTVSGAAGVTVRNEGNIVAQYKEVSLRKRQENEWVLA